MKIRDQLITLVLASLAPISLVALWLSQHAWDVQRKAIEQSFLERVSGLRLALDAEIESHSRIIRTLADIPDAEASGDRSPIAERANRLLVQQPAWSMIGVAAPDGTVLTAHVRPRAGLPRALDPVTRTRAIASSEPVMSDLIRSEFGGYDVFIAQAVIRDNVARGIVYVAIDPKYWLAFLRRYPIASSATLTLSDRNGLIIARTLNSDQSEGMKSGPAFWDQTIGRNEGSFRSPGLEGQHFYVAFSRLRTTGGTLGTGVPEQDVEAALYSSTIALAAGLIGAALVAITLAVLLGARIAKAIKDLARFAERIGTDSIDKLKSARELPVVEAEAVRRTLLETGQLLDARQASLRATLAREAGARIEAERSSSAKDEYVAMLGHEIRNPLSAIKTAMAVLDRIDGNAEVARRTREIVQRQVGNLSVMVDDLLDAARLKAGKVSLACKPIDLAESVRDVVSAFSAEGRTAHLDFSVQLAPAVVFADRARLEQIIVNLLDNACKYTSTGGRVVISVALDGPFGLLSVVDDGSGISPELLPHIFDVFEQGERSRERHKGGLGLGLSIVYRLVDLHGGAIEASSAGVNRGATFLVRLPLAVNHPVALHDPGLRQTAMQRIAVVEDQDDNRESIAALLRMLGHVVIEARDGPTGVNAILEGKVDVALVDLGLPGFDGNEVARRVRMQASREISLIALTGYGSPRDREEAIAAGFDEYLVKPFDVEKFERLIREKRVAG